jgi:hypothetical protein
MLRTPPWLWLNLLSLDAPVVALVWQDLAARSFGTPLRPAARVVLGLTVWAVYLADRLLDVRATVPLPNTARHHFYRRHPRVMSALLAAVLVADACVAILKLRRAVFLDGVGVAVCVAAYLSIFPLRPSCWEKQVFAAMLFSIGVLLVSFTWLGPWRLLLPAALFGVLCLCNLVLIEYWEGGRKGRFIWLAPAVVAGLAMLPPAGRWQHAVTLSGVLLAAVAIAGPRLTVAAKRVLADAALLTPLLFR